MIKARIKDYRICGLLPTVTTDVAWRGRLSSLGCVRVVYMPKGSSPVRAQNIRRHGAECTITELNYDDTVRLAAKTAREQGWVLLQDTAWQGYEQIPHGSCARLYDPRC